MSTMVTIETLFEATKIFEDEVKKCDFDSILDKERNIYKFKGKLRSKIVVVSVHSFPKVYFEKLLPSLTLVFNTGGNFSDTINYICGTFVTNGTRKEIQAIGAKDGFNVEVIDLNDLRSIASIADIFSSDNMDDTSQFEKMAFDYLSKSNDSTFVKNGLYYSQVLFAVFENKAITITELQSVLTRRFGKKIDSLDSDINYLRRIGKIRKKDKNEALVVLTDDENENIRASITESQALETEFKEKFKKIVSCYGISDSDSAFDKLRNFYTVRSNSLQSSEVLGRFDTTQKTNDTESLYKELIKLGCTDVRVTNCMKEIETLCSQNGYLNRISVVKSFFNLYKSNKYKEYVDNKMNVVMLDTPVFLNYLCAKSKYNTNEETYDNNDFKVVNSLAKFRNKNGKKIRFMLPYDYASETIGELKKAIQLSQFEVFANIGIPVYTSNILYNYYLYVKETLKANVSNFVDFAKELGFQNVDLNSPRFFYDNYVFLRSFMEFIGDEYIDKLSMKIDNYDSIISAYSIYLESEKKYSKTPKAIESDVRQSNYLLNSERDENIEYYLTSWDSTLYRLREIVKEKTSSPNYYAIHRPGALINRLSLKDFRIDDSCFTSEIFAYADKSYSVTDKIRNLYDNVLVPYFSAINNKNTELVKKVLSMQKAAIDSMEEGQESERDMRFPLEELFVNIEEEMSKNGCTQTDLRMFLSDDNNNEYFMKMLAETTTTSKDCGKADFSKQFCKDLKKYIAEKDREENETGNLNTKELLNIDVTSIEQESLNAIKM